MTSFTYACGQKGPLIMPEKKYPASDSDVKELKKNEITQ